MKVIGYIRVSTDKQAEKGMSLEIQREKIEAYCGLYDLELIEVIEDAGSSAKSLNRAGIQRAIDMLSSGEAEGIVVLKLDRLTRSIRDLNTLLEDTLAKSSLISVQEQVDTRTPAGRLVLNILMSVSQWEREETGARTKAAMEGKKAKGEYTGGITPLGWETSEDGGLQPNEREQAMIDAVRAYKDAGRSYSWIATRFNKEGKLTRKGHSRWSKSMIKRLHDARSTDEQRHTEEASA